MSAARKKPANPQAAPRQILDEDGHLVAGASVPEGLGDDDLRELYRLMLRQRLLDDLMLTLQRQGRIGFYGPATGQEAAVFGSGKALAPGDWVLPALREGGVALMRGYPLRDYLAQCFGNALDLTHGRQMPCHYGSRAQNQPTLSSPIGTQLPHATGVAWAMKLKRADTIAIGYLGDGATSENDFHTALDFAGRFTLPVVFFCQNNQWAISVPVSGQTAAKSLADKARAYRMPGVQVDGNDVLAVYATTREARARAVAGEGPTFIEALTWRMGAHSTSDDPTRYRDESVTEQWKARDPILRLGRFLVAQRLSTERDLELLREAQGREIREVLAEVEAASPMVALHTMFDDVYAVRPPHLEAQAAEAETFGIPTPPH
ncbi:MAG: thiamine pyrophosphate-dependent dehydrogenase E1 component subunit alpha [Myxococcota bacterium]